MKLSIITCTYNSENHLQKCIDSVIAQNLDTNIYEHIFVDAYSTDKTEDIILEYKKSYPNVKIIKLQPKGVYNAMNRGIENAKGDYILCLNSDDYLEKNILGEYLYFIESTNKKDLYYADRIVHENKQKKEMVVGTKLNKRLFFNTTANTLVYHPTVLCKRDTILKLGLFDENMKISSDFGMWLKFLKEKKTFEYFPYKTTNFVVHGNNLSQNTNQALYENRYFRKKYFGLKGLFFDYLFRLRLKLLNNN